MIRSLVAIAAMIAIYFFLEQFFAESGRLSLMVMAAMTGGFFFMGTNIILERMGDAKEVEYRRIFPDFMDMLTTCVDAGLSIEAAISRVSREMLLTHPDFGLHLTVMTLEIRGGRRVRDALANLGNRLHIDEAKSLAVLFRQSEELGTSITKSLRVYSAEMRQLRIIRAEEKANALPIKMLFPMAISLFPVSLIMVLAPLVIRIATMLKGLVAPGT
jgi:tight adherence protein C